MENGIWVSKIFFTSFLNTFVWTLFQVFKRVKWMLSAEVISALIKLS